MRAGLGLCRTQRQVGEDTREVRTQLPPDELRVDFGIEVLHVEQVHHLRWLWSDLLGDGDMLTHTLVVVSGESIFNMLFGAVFLVCHSGPYGSIAATVDRGTLLGRDEAVWGNRNLLTAWRSWTSRTALVVIKDRKHDIIGYLRRNLL